MDRKEYIPWFFEEDGDHASGVQEMVDAIRRHGLPFMESNVTIESICGTLADSLYGWPEQLAYRLPVAYYLAGDIDRAKAVLENHLAALGQRVDPAAQDYRAFAAQFRREL
jgi:hypothetical protein